MQVDSNLEAKEIRQIDLGTIDIGPGGAISIRISGKVTDVDGNVTQVIEPREGHSFVQGFVKYLFIQMGGKVGAQSLAHEGPYISGTYDFGEIIADHIPGTTARIILVAASSNNLNGRWVHISEATHSGGSNSDLNVERINLDYVSSNNYDCYLDEAQLVPLDTSGDGSYDANSASIWHWRADSSNLYSSINLLSDPFLILGLGNTAVSIMDQWPRIWSYAMYQGAQTQTVAAAVSSAGRTYIPMTRQFTNTSGASVTVEEIVLIGKTSANNYTPGLVFTRDIQQIIIPDTQTLTLEYELETNMDLVLTSSTLGGITEWFLKALNRNIRNVTVTVNDLSNVGRSYAQMTTTLNSIGPGGDQRLRNYAGSASGTSDNTYKGGIMLGTDDGSALVVDEHNYNLGEPILHGRASGELYHFGTMVDDLEIKGGAWGYISLDTGASGSVAGITVNSVQIMSGAEAFDTDLTTTATNVATNINAYTSSPNYNAVAVGRTVTIKALDDTGTSANTFVVAASPAWTTITSSVTALADGNTAQFKIRRLFKNESGEDIIVKESALILNQEDSVFGKYHFLAARYIRDGTDSRPAATTVADGEVIQAVMIVKATVS